VLLIILFWNPFSFTFAKSKVIYERSENLAKQYIENSLNDDNWKGKNPYISWEWKNFYTDDEKNPSYIEFKVSCDNQKDCWFILVNSDWNDVVVPIASSSWIWPWELLTLQNEDKVNKKNKENKTNNKSNNKLYYFWPLEQYSIDEGNVEVISINPQDDIEQIVENDKTLKKEDKEKEIKNKKRELKSRVDDYKIKSKEYKKSDEFKKHKEEIKDEILKMPKEEFVLKKLDKVSAIEIIGWDGYVLPTYASNKFVPWNNYTWCNWKIPCYKQFSTSYNWQNCLVWCVPTAYAMIYWYYDRKWDFPNLIPWTAPTLNDENQNTTINNVIKEIWSYSQVKCNWNDWVTSTNSWTLSIQYAVNKWYIKSSATPIWSTDLTYLFNNIKSEINYGRPLIWWDWTHAMVIYWYYNTTNTNLKIIRVNLWGWPLYILKTSVWNKYYGSSIDYNINSIYYNYTNHELKTIVKVIISN